MATNKSKSAPAKSAPATKQAPAKNAGKAAPAATTGAKVGKIDKSAQAAQRQEIAKRAAPASGQAAEQGQKKVRGQFAGKSINSLVPKGEEAKARGNAGLLLAHVLKHKRVDDVIGTEYQRAGGKYDGESVTVRASDLAYLANRGLIEIK